LNQPAGAKAENRQGTNIDGDLVVEEFNIEKLEVPKLKP
jgi:hypothetical protein